MVVNKRSLLCEVGKEDNIRSSSDDVQKFLSRIVRRYIDSDLSFLDDHVHHRTETYAWDPITGSGDDDCNFHLPHHRPPHLFVDALSKLKVAYGTGAATSQAQIQQTLASKYTLTSWRKKLQTLKHKRRTSL